MMPKVRVLQLLPLHTATTSLNLRFQLRAWPGHGDMVAISVIAFDGQIWRADDDSSLTDLLDAVFTAPREQHWYISMIAFASPGPGLLVPHLPRNRLRAAIDPTCNWAALRFLQLCPEQHLWQSWTSLSRNVTFEAPRLCFGGRRSMCPRTATITADSCRKAVAEYSHTTCRPDEVLWQLPATFKPRTHE